MTDQLESARFAASSEVQLLSPIRTQRRFIASRATSATAPGAGLIAKTERKRLGIGGRTNDLCFLSLRLSQTQEVQKDELRLPGTWLLFSYFRSHSLEILEASRADNGRDRGVLRGGRGLERVLLGGEAQAQPKATLKEKEYFKPLFGKFGKLRVNESKFHSIMTNEK